MSMGMARKRRGAESGMIKVRDLAQPKPGTPNGPSSYLSQIPSSTGVKARIPPSFLEDLGLWAKTSSKYPCGGLLIHQRWCPVCDRSLIKSPPLSLIRLQVLTLHTVGKQKPRFSPQAQALVHCMTLNHASLTILLGTPVLPLLPRGGTVRSE